MQAIRGNRWLNQFLEHAPDYLSLVLVILCGFLLARLVWVLFPADPSHLPTAVPVATDNAESTTTANFGAQIANYHLFGETDPSPVAKSTESKPLQATPLALKLLGVYAIAGGRGQAVIEENGEQRVYGVGQSIGGTNTGVVLEAIKSDHIVLRRNGNLETLALPELQANASTDNQVGALSIPDMPVMDDTANTVQGMAMQVPPPDVTAPADTEQVSPTDSSPVPDAPVSPNGSVPTNVRLEDVVSWQPHEVNGKFGGFRIMPGSNVELFNRLGLQPQDVVTAINGTVLDSPAAGMQAMQAAAGASQVNLSITRGGQQINLPITFDR